MELSTWPLDIGYWLLKISTFCFQWYSNFCPFKIARGNFSPLCASQPRGNLTYRYLHLRMIFKCKKFWSILSNILFLTIIANYNSCLPGVCMRKDEWRATQGAGANNVESISIWFSCLPGFSKLCCCKQRSGETQGRARTGEGAKNVLNSPDFQIG